jgi:hypothetical protein
MRPSFSMRPSFIADAMMGIAIKSDGSMAGLSVERVG